ncbi:adaptin ear-binding coat-associated protein 1 NECAP-1 [Wilcoxina mikolae CBS 423.85]|nr:adaptin ear-binding coat-associated protein 1 NECAP-1 [Wilcoxina mikolae CBS 423.85]
MTDEIQRVLFVAPKVHIYAVPPLTSNQGYKASLWNVDNEKARIFTARIRIIETATVTVNDEETVKTDVRLEDPKSGDLFANCPYEGAFCVEQVVDSSRFFAVRVVDGPRKAILGIGFEDRSDAFDFGVALQEIRRHMDATANSSNDKKLNGAQNNSAPLAEKKDYSLKEGETISITIGNKGRRRAPSANNKNGQLPLPFLPPPPSAEDVKRRQSRNLDEEEVKLGFDDDAFGDFV